ncbi:hypothetical protein [Kallotenue papyrolyticum]|uniref:hypothetical protein n=1 Tax=Kallotenue papyrolyticum TaxID=1325125 RepID=UPI000478572C|nr:hypothetical protein [Kallotenue papyrolyticum]
MTCEQPSPSPPGDLERLAAWLRRAGLTTPALLLIGTLRPLHMVGGQLLRLAYPLAPTPRWQTRLGQMASAIEDEATWTRLENLLQ